MAKAESLRIPAPQRLSYDRDEANSLINEAFDQVGWLQTAENGDTAHDLDKLRHAVFVSFTTEHAVTAIASKSGRQSFNKLVAEKAVTKLGLYVELFPNGPAAQHAPESEEEEAARDYIAKYIWNLTTPSNRKAWLQREVADSGLIVLETKVYPEDPTIPRQPGRYVTDVEHAMLEFLDHKVFEDVRRQLSETDEWLSTFIARKPEIALIASRKARAAIKAAVENATHADPNYVRDSLAITAGTDED